MTILVQQPDFGAVEAEEKVSESGEENELVLDGGFVEPPTNAFGHTFRDYDVSSERRDGVEEFYRINHIYQSVDFVNNQLLIWFFFDFLIRSLLYVMIGWMFNN